MDNKLRDQVIKEYSEQTKIAVLAALATLGDDEVIKQLAETQMKLFKAFFDIGFSRQEALSLVIKQSADIGIGGSK